MSKVANRKGCVSGAVGCGEVRWAGVSVCAVLVLWSVVSLRYAVKFTSRHFMVQVWAGWVGVFHFSLARPESGVSFATGWADGTSAESALWFKMSRNGPRDWGLDVPMWSLLAVAAVPTAVMSWRDRRKFGAGRCRQCGYELAGLSGGVCPECGATIA